MAKEKSKKSLDVHRFWRFVVAVLLFVAILTSAGLLAFFMSVKEHVFAFVFFALLIAFVIASIVFLVILFERERKGEKDAILSMNAQVEALNRGDVIASAFATRNKAMNALQNNLSLVLSRYSRLHVVVANEAQHREVALRVKQGDTFSESEFHNAVINEIGASAAYRSALLFVRLESKSESIKPSMRALKKAIREAFPEAMIGEYGKNGFGIYLFAIDNPISLKERAEGFVETFHKLIVGNNEASEMVEHCSLGGAIYPYVNVDEIFKVAQDALESSEDVNIVYDVENIHIPNTILSDPTRASLCDVFLERFESHYYEAKTHAERIQVLEAMTSWIAGFLNLGGGGILDYDPLTDSYRVVFDIARSEEEKTFTRLGEQIDANLIDPFYNAAKNEPYFAVDDINNLPSELANAFRNIGVRSVYLKPVYSRGEKRSLIYLTSREVKELGTDFVHGILHSYSTLATIECHALRGELRGEDGDKGTINALAAHTKRYLYTIDRRTHRIAWISDNLASLYPEAKVGALCHKVLRNQEEPCPNCPLLRRSERTILPEISPTPSLLSVLEYRSNNNDLSTILIETQQTESNLLSSKLIDEALMIRNDRALALNINRDCKNNNPAYVLCVRFTDLKSLIRELPGADVISVMGTIVKNFQDAGYGELLYRQKEDVLCFYLLSYTKSRAISFVEEAAEILQIPIETGATSVIPATSFCLIATPHDVLNARQFQTLMDDDLARSEKLGNGYLVDQTNSRPRYALRSAYVTELLKEAVEHENMKVFIQPIVDAKTFRSEAGDLRAALYAPDRSSIAPSEFIPLAEKAALVSKVDASSLHALGELFSEYGYGTFKTMGLTNLAIYLSQDSIKDPSFPDAVKRAYDLYHFPKGYVIFTLRMSYLDKMADEVSALIKALDGKGIQWSVSDFNPERDSLETVAKFGIKRIKTAAGLVTQAKDNARDMASFARFVAEALKEGYHITATGIESEEHALFAQSQHVQSLEGYYFGRPVDQDDFVMDVTYGADKEKSAHSA